MLSIVKSMSLHGLEGFLIDVQVDVSAGMPSWQVVGLPDTTVKESNERVKTAIKNSGYEFQSRKIVVNLAPADTKKEGSFFDLPIAVGILTNFEEIKQQNLDDTVFIGELSLDGKLNHINGILPMCIEAKKIGIKRIILPKENEEEASIVDGIDVIGVKNLQQVVNYLNNIECIAPKSSNIEDFFKKQNKYSLDFSEVKGQENIKRALEVAAARWT
jgi:magnesium chelatase family protein